MAHSSSARLPSIKSMLLILNLVFLILPLGSLYLLRIYESALVRQTESELISQAAFVAATYKHELLRTANGSLPSLGPTLSDHAFPGNGMTAVTPKLDLATDPVLPPRPKPEQSQQSPHPRAIKAGLAIQPILREAQRITLSGIKVLDPHGIVVAGQEERGLSFAHIDEFKQARQGSPVSMLRQRRTSPDPVPLGSLSRGATINVFVALPIVHENRLLGVVWVNRTPTDLMKALYGKRFELTATLLILLGIVIATTTFTSFTMSYPLLTLVEQTRRVARGEKAVALPIKHPMTLEIDQLSNSIATMADTLQRRSDYIQHFATHVSHEFKTPLTAIQGSIELLRDHLQEMPLEQQQRFINNIAEDTDRLKRLVTRLLELARADMSQPQETSVDLKPVLESLQTYYAPRGLALEISPPWPESPLAVQMTMESLEAVFGNLLENSLLAGATQVTIAWAADNETLNIKVLDNGPGISEANQDQIFTPFFTTRRTAGGTGLGLSIIKALLQGQQGDIVLAPSDTGACFQITLPTPY